MSKVYLSGGIMHFSQSDIHDWRENAKKMLKIPSVDPTRISYRDRTAKEIVELDKSDIDSCTHLLVYFIRPSVGTSMEILYAYERKKNVYIVNPSGQELSPWLMYHSAKVFNSLAEAVEDINNEPGRSV